MTTDDMQRRMQSAPDDADLRVVLTDPEEARAFIDALYALSVEEQTFAVILKLFLEGALMRMIADRAQTDNAFALDCAQLIHELMLKLGRPVLRGKPKKARSA